MNFIGVSMDWVVALTGDEIDLQELSKVWNRPELTIEKGTTAYVLKSTYFDSLSSDLEVRERAGRLLIPINAGIKLELGASRQIELAHTRLINPDGSKIAYVMCYDVLSARAFCSTEITKDGEKEIRNPADPIVNLFNIAHSDQQVNKVCLYINQDFNSWPILYKIYEVIRADGFIPLQKGGKYEQKAALFRRSANNPSSGGLNSRHAIDNSPPLKPMSLYEAQIFIKMLIQEWLETKKT